MNPMLASLSPQTLPAFTTTGYSIRYIQGDRGLNSLVRGDNNEPFIFPTLREAQENVADDLLTQIYSYLDGEREFEDAMHIEDEIIPIMQLPNGDLVKEDLQPLFVGE